MGSSNIYAANPYKLGEVDYFRHKNVGDSEAQYSPFDWREPTVSLDGHVTYYTPPEPMLTLLENPTAENAKAYLSWQKMKVERILKAQEAINQELNKDKL